MKKDTDGIYYWTLDGEWLTDEKGNKVKAQGTDGKDGVDGEDGNDGVDGEDGTDGTNGKDGITPQLKIENGRWMLSMDNGKTWTDIGLSLIHILCIRDRCLKVALIPLPTQPTPNHRLSALGSLKPDFQTMLYYVTQNK